MYFILRVISFELLEDLSVGLAGDIGEDIEASAVWHTDAGFIEARFSSRGDDGIEEWNDGFATFEREALLSDELGMQEGFECFCAIDLAENAKLFLARKARSANLHFLLNPLSLLWVLDIHVFDTYGAAIGIAKDA